jgi:hypothetical protein
MPIFSSRTIVGPAWSASMRRRRAIATASNSATMTITAIDKAASAQPRTIVGPAAGPAACRK